MFSPTLTVAAGVEFSRQDDRKPLGVNEPPARAGIHARLFLAHGARLRMTGVNQTLRRETRADMRSSREPIRETLSERHDCSENN